MSFLCVLKILNLIAPGHGVAGEVVEVQEHEFTLSVYMVRVLLNVFAIFNVVKSRQLNP